MWAWLCINAQNAAKVGVLSGIVKAQTEISGTGQQKLVQFVIYQAV